jgi:hypothetical protein
MLRLDGAPVDPSYQAEYPNPASVHAMEVTLEDDGNLVAECQRNGAEVRCTETPFSAEVIGMEGRHILVRVFDLYGRLVGEVQKTHSMASASLRSEGDEDAPEYRTAPAPEEDDGTDREPPQDGEDCPGGEFDGEGCESEQPPQDRTDCPRPEIKERFCQGVNERLAEEGLDYQLDCAELPDSFEVPEFDSDDVFDETEPPVDRCRDLTDPTEDALEEELDEKDDWCGEIQLDTWADNARNTLIRDGICDSSPLVLDLDGDGVALTSTKRGVLFDLRGTGERVQTAWPEPGNGLLALDRNDNGRIDDGSELFGNATAGRTYTHGFQPLAELDENGDGFIGPADPAFESLVVWTDRNRNGFSEPQELRTLEQAGIAGLHTAARQVDRGAATDEHGNRIPYVGRFVRSDGSTGALVDAFLRYRPVSSRRLARAGGTAAGPICGG